MSVSNELLAALARWDTPALSNALRRHLGVPESTRSTDGSIHRLAGTTLAGFAVTAQMSASEGGRDEIPVTQLHRAVMALPGPAVVVIEDTDSPAGQGAFLGEVNGTLLTALDISGFITNGRVRDINELRDLGYAVHAQGLCVARAHMHLTDVGNPVCVAGLQVSPGDLLHGDEHGVLQIPAAAAADLVEVAATIRDEEQTIVRWALSDEFTHEGLLNLRRVRH